MSVIRAVRSALPQYYASNVDVEKAAKVWLEGKDDQFALFRRFMSSARIETRYFSVPVSEIASLEGGEAKAAVFERTAPRLAHEAAGRVLADAGITPSDIDGIVFCSCSCPLIPSADTYLVDSLGLRRDIVRVPAYQFGCAGGLIGAALADRLCASLENVLLVSTELCSLVFQPDNRDASHLVGAAIFGDGAAAALISKGVGPGLEIIGKYSYLIPNTRHLMGYDIKDSGSHLRLDKELPSHLVKVVPEVVSGFLHGCKLSSYEVKWWLFHPGSAKILSFLEEVLELEHAQCCWSAEVLSQVGNLSSASIMFIMERFLRSRETQPGDLTVVLGIGPGLTIELLLARVC